MIAAIWICGVFVAGAAVGYFIGLDRGAARVRIERKLRRLGVA